MNLRAVAHQLRAWQRRRRIQRAVGLIRREMLCWGVDTSHLSDEELAATVQEIGKAVASAGLPAVEAATFLADVAGLAAAALVDAAFSPPLPTA